MVSGNGKQDWQRNGGNDQGLRDPVAVEASVRLKEADGTGH